MVEDKLFWAGESRTLRSTLILYDLKEFAFEDQSVAWFDLVAGWVVAVTQLTWNINTDFPADIRLGESTGESLDYASHWKACRLLSLH